MYKLKVVFVVIVGFACMSAAFAVQPVNSGKREIAVHCPDCKVGISEVATRTLPFADKETFEAGADALVFACPNCGGILGVEFNPVFLHERGGNHPYSAGLLPSGQD